MNGLRTLKRKRHLSTCQLPPKPRPAALRALVLLVTEAPCTPTRRGQAGSGGGPACADHPRMLILTHHLLCDTLQEVSHTLVYQLSPQLENRGRSPHLGLCAASGWGQQAGWKQPASHRQEPAASRQNSGDPARVHRQSVSAEKGRKLGQVSTGPLTLLWAPPLVWPMAMGAQP